MAIINPVTGREMVENANNMVLGGTPTNISSAGTYLIKSGAGILRKLVINQAISLGVITVYDSLTGSGTVIAKITNPLALLQQTIAIDYNAAFSIGLTVKTSLGDNVTVVWE